jgi:hypothetical protein
MLTMFSTEIKLISFWRQHDCFEEIVLWEPTCFFKHGSLLCFCVLLEKYLEEFLDQLSPHFLSIGYL